MDLLVWRSAGITESCHPHAVADPQLSLMSALSANQPIHRSIHTQDGQVTPTLSSPYSSHSPITAGGHLQPT